MPTSLIPGLKVERVTPAKARHWLALNDPDNRSASRPYIGRYSRDMEFDRWRWQLAEPIHFMDLPDGTEIMINGQKRLRAIVQSGKAIPMVVVRHLTEADRLVVDSGQRRTLGHKLAIRRVPDPNNVAATLNILLPWRSGSLTNRMEPPTEGEVYDFVDEYQELINVAIKVARTTHDNIGSRMPVCAAAYIQLALILDDPTQPDLDMISFFDTLMTGELIEPGSPVGALRRTLIKRSKSLQNPLGRWEELAYFVRAINMWIADKKEVRALALRRPITEDSYRIALLDQTEELTAE